MSFENGVFIPIESTETGAASQESNRGNNESSSTVPTRGRGNRGRSFQHDQQQKDQVSGRGNFRQHRNKRGAVNVSSQVNHGNHPPPSLMDLEHPFELAHHASALPGARNTSFNPNAPAFQPRNFRSSNNTQLHNDESCVPNRIEINGEVQSKSGSRRNRSGKRGGISGQRVPTANDLHSYNPSTTQDPISESSRKGRRDHYHNRNVGTSIRNDMDTHDYSFSPLNATDEVEATNEPKRNRFGNHGRYASQQTSSLDESDVYGRPRPVPRSDIPGGRDRRRDQYQYRNQNFRDPYETYNIGHSEEYGQYGRESRDQNSYGDNSNRFRQTSAGRDSQPLEHPRSKSSKFTKGKNHTTAEGANEWRAGASRGGYASVGNSHGSQPGQSDQQDPFSRLNVAKGLMFETVKDRILLTTEIPSGSRKHDHRNQRETLTDQLSRNALDCMICVEKVRRSQPVWSCSKCFNVFHLNCLRKWANSSADEVGWRCPGCQTNFEVIPSDYRCFCGSVKNPQGVRSDVPHSCGQTCGRSSIGGVDCVHSCSIQCHPGPCPPCEALQNRNCCCGKTKAQVKCSSKAVLTCENNCDKMLNCGIHKCTRQCHGGSCDPCEVKIKFECYCGSETKEVLCTEETCNTKDYSCTKICKRILNCKSHSCEDVCHSGPCKPCKMSTQAILSCPCGQTSIAEACLRRRMPLRKSCLDPIPTCGKTCRKILPCGESGQSHKCQAECHLAPQCPPCGLVTPVKCRCGNKTFEIPCRDFQAKDDVLCEKKCTKKRSCGRHKCNTKCCIDPDHICSIVCDRPLRCGNHNCAVLCHNGHCPACRIVSFDELECECGSTKIYPPVPCGTKPPPCKQPCTRTHECDHPVLHSCHSERCPPCTVLTNKWCNGNHELRKNVMCHISQVSCGMPCKKLLSCGRHSCVRICHPNDCLARGEVCKLQCTTPKPECGHCCGAPCHDGPCPESKCKLSTEVTCECNRKKETMVCWKREKEYDRLVFYMMGIELKRLRNVDPSTKEEVVIDEASVLASIKEKTPKANVLECGRECARVERNRKLVEALQLEDPDVTSTFGTPNYSEFLTTFAKKNPQFVEMIHERLTKLVVKARQSKRKNETYAFESMNRDKRHVVHEYSDHFGCLSESFDEEPNRNVLCTASKEKSYIPAVSLIDAVFRPNLKSERKNAFNDVEIFQNSKSQILRPANGKIRQTPVIGTGMVALSGPSTASVVSNGEFPPLS